MTVITCAPNFPTGKVYPGYRNKLYQTKIMDGIRVVRVKTFIAKNEGVVFRILDFISFMFSGYFAGLFEKKPDVIVATSPQFFTAVAGWMLGAIRRVPFIFELSDLWPATIVAVGALSNKTIRKYLEKFELFLYHQSSLVISLTQSFKDNLVRRNISLDKIEVVINGVDLYRYFPRHKSEKILQEIGLKERFIVGYIGTHGLYHALENVLIVADRLREKKNIRFLFVGDGATRGKLISSHPEIANFEA